MKNPVQLINATVPVRISLAQSPLRRGFLLIPLALAVSLAITARANGPRDLISSSAAPSHGSAASPLIKALPTHPLWSGDTIIYDNGGPNQQNGNEMTAWIQAEDFNLSADSTLTIVNFWDIEAPGGAAYQGEIDWTLYADAGGMPGAAFASGAAVGGDVTRTFIQGGVLGFYDEYSDSFNISPGVALTAGTTYWLGLHNGPLTFTTRSEFYWETTDFNGTFTGHEDEAPFDGVWFDNFSEHAFNLEGTTGGGGLTFDSAFSEKGVFDIDLPLTGPSGVEDRSGAPNRKFTVVMTFNNTITSIGSASSTCGSVQSTSVSGSTVTINLVGVAHGCNGSDITITANDVMDDQGNTLSSASVAMGLLLGDVNGDRVVNSLDTNEAQMYKGQKTVQQNFRSDVNADGHITYLDIQIIRQQHGTSLP
jgi:hypothetical protein